MSKSFDKETRTVFLMTNAEDFTDQVNTETSFISFFIVELSINNFWEFVDKRCVIEDKNISDFLNGLAFVDETVDKIDSLVHLGEAIKINNPNNCLYLIKWLGYNSTGVWAKYRFIK